MKMFKIQNPEGKFSRGSSNPGFTKFGKVWNARSHINSHLNCVYKLSVYDDCFLIEYNVQEDGSSVVVSKTPMSDVIAEWTIKSEKTRLEREEKDLKYQRASLERRKLELAYEMVNIKKKLEELK